MKSLSEGQVRMRKKARKLPQKKKINSIEIYHHLIFLHLLATMKHENFAFNAQEDDDSMSISSNQDFSYLDDCIDQSCKTKSFSIANLIRGRQPKQQKTEDLRPIAFVRFNTSLGKAKPVTIKALLDSGASDATVNEKFATVRNYK